MSDQPNTLQVAYVRRELLNEEPAPASSRGPVAWLRESLFSSIPYTILTLLCIYILYVIIPPVVDFMVTNAVWTGSDRAVCATEAQGGIQPNGWFGACWAYVDAYANQFIYGRYPDAEQWRVNIVALLFFGGLAPLLIPAAPFKRENMLFMVFVFPLVAVVLLTGGDIAVSHLYIPLAVLAVIALGVVYAFAKGSESDPLPGLKTTAAIFAGLFVMLFVLGFDFGLRHVETEVWGGLLVTLVIAVTGIAASLPLGIALALGRRSALPIVRFFSIVFIEFWRGVPLITVLFMSSVMLPLFLPEGVTFDKLLRALIGVALFSSAYMAEVVRGGLQALPKGQYEGAMALGLNWTQMMRMIILPQALKLVIPGIVNTFIGLFKDTTLVLIIGLFDFLGQIQSSFSDPAWSSPVQSLTGYFFAAIVYFIFCFGMSRYSMYMERRLDTGHKR
ncbi:amino acid ABC transporter permease [Oricola cellulosilytica]|uniref:Amino acid ABC transporter permease n=1 Tax=Oricola cellulosilytica TaxID=1429082 RepID=A0A4R0PBD8_9HYPH|nr:amino acid ABC transporter permease [Oricola cellulosilytica]TCD14570.1 amino acid ABC transporter permease [Oricola cellulosilytica]